MGHATPIECALLRVVIHDDIQSISKAQSGTREGGHESHFSERAGQLSRRANIGVAQNAHPFRISSHDAVLDPIVDHLDEVAGAVSAAMQVFAIPSNVFGEAFDCEVFSRPFRRHYVSFVSPTRALL